MTRRNWIARTRTASGRFLFALTAGAASCQAPPARVLPEPAPRFADPVLERGALAPAREARAAQLYREAEEALEGGDAARAQALAAEVVELYPQAPVSGMALLTFARAALLAGAPDTAERAADRFARLLAEGDPRAAEARLLQAEALERRGDEAARLERLLLIEAGAPTNAVLRAVDAAREASGRLERADLERVLRRTPPGQAVRPVALARYAVLLDESGDADEAERFARAALDAGARGTDSLRAVAVLSGTTVAELMGAEPTLPPIGADRTLTLGTILPTGGSPAFRDFAQWVAEGVEVAAATWLEGVPVAVEARDDMASPAQAASALGELEREGVAGVVGFLEEGALGAAVDRRARGTPLVSPTARVASGDGVYTLSGADPQSAVAMARYAARAGFRRVAMIHSRSPESVEEADAFEGALRSLGVPLVGRFPYNAGSTYFQEQIRGAQEALRGAEIRALGLGPDDTLHVDVLEPVALFVPVPPEDVELVAPQITFFGLDTLAIRVLGTGGWTDRQALETVDPRHTTGVVATAPAPGGPGSPGYARFRQAYERHFQRTLVSPVPALGYDAALLLLEGARNGARTPQQLAAALGRVRDVEGATGILSIIGGRVQRRTEVVLIEHGALIPTG